MITSLQNPRVKYVRSLQMKAKARKEEQAFVVEGVRLAEEALAARWDAHLVLYTEDLNQRGRNVVDGFIARKDQVVQVTPQVFQAASDTKSPQGLLVVLPIRTMSLSRELDFVFILDTVRDPGNLGTMLRTAAAAGVSGVFIPPGSVDPFAPKVVRAAMGAHFYLPIRSITWKEIRAYLKNTPMQIYLAEAGAGSAYSQIDFRSPLGLIIGGEAEGAGEEAKRSADTYVHIPMPGGIESLNTAVAASIILFEIVRQRDRKCSQIHP